MEEPERIIFAKPSANGFCFIVTFEKNGQIYIDEAFFAENARELNRKIAENSSGAESVRYDVSVFMQEGKDLRELIPDVDVVCYKPKQKLEQRIVSQFEFMKESIVLDSEYDNPDYCRFVELFSTYCSWDKTTDTIAVDILSDAAKYYRREMTE